ncbi:MAG: hypothetical protein Q7S50_01190 [bacterium]|nr:hypothetical protein [bacterium]
MTKAKTPRAKHFIREYYDRPVTRRELLRRQKEEVTAEYVAQRLLVKNKVFTLASLKNYVKKGLLRTTRFNGKHMLLKEDLARIIETEAAAKRKTQARLF